MTDAQQSRAAASKHRFLCRGFRPFFLSAALWALLAMALWLATLTGELELPSAFDPISWHAHEALFGYLGAVFAGFLLTAVPNWTGRPPLAGWPLAVLLALWVLGRIAVVASESLTPLAVALLDLFCPVVLGGYVLREIVTGRNWRNLVVVSMIGVFVAGNALFHWEAAEGADAASGYGLRIGLAAAIMMISVIGGRIVPTFTRNWLAARGSDAQPAAFGRFDGLVLALTLLALATWVMLPRASETGYLLLASGFTQAARLTRWRGPYTGREPLLWILHVGYTFVPLGMLGVGVAILWPDTLALASAQHLWMAGAIGVMTLAVMTRATLGHSGRALTAGAGTVAIYSLVITSVLARLAGGVLPDQAMALWTLASLLWCCGFAGFVLLYGRLLIGAAQR
ncbi:MAG: NnrS family protein [Rhodospirillaceae bacterium]|nr:NnrS family protein [Rhodospirillaceae bacterium]